MRSQKASSTKTRIKTHLRSELFSCIDKVLKKQVPQKQGLRQIMPLLHGGGRVAQKASSTKTRIKTSRQHVLLRFLHCVSKSKFHKNKD